MVETWITTEEASKISEYHPDHIRRLLRSGDIQGRKWGKEWMINRDSLLTYIKRIETRGEKRGPKKS